VVVIEIPLDAAATVYLMWFCALMFAILSPAVESFGHWLLEMRKANRPQTIIQQAQHHYDEPTDTMISEDGLSQPFWLGIEP